MTTAQNQAPAESDDSNAEQVNTYVLEKRINIDEIEPVDVRMQNHLAMPPLNS